MKKWVGFVIAVLFIFQGTGVALAIPRGTPEYEKMKEYKRLQREKKKDPQPQGQAKGFWQKEAERSGFAGTAAMFGGVLGNAIPFEKPNSRKQPNQS